MSNQGLAEEPYAPPAAVSPPEGSAVDRAWRDGVLALLLLPASVGLLVLTVVVAGATDARIVGTVGCGTAVLVALAGGALGIRSLVRARSSVPLGAGLTAGIVVAVLGSGLMAFFGAILTMWATVGFRRGRQLRRFGRVLLPRIDGSGSWARLPLSVTVDEGTRAALAAQWRENGRTEHASVGAFARLTLDLMALGAPPALVAAANRDALDEIRHAELCFSLARAIDGETASPAAFPEAARARTLPAGRMLALAALAVDSLVDGALHEGVSARVVAKLARRCEEPAIRAVLKEIAADEGRHAAHGWDVVEWCLDEGGRPVADALRGAVAAIPQSVRSPLPEPAQGGGWERLGIHGHALEAAEHAAARAELARRVERMIDGERAAA